MTIKKQSEYIMRKYPETRYSTARFMIRWMEEFLGVKEQITYSQFREFWKSEATLERNKRELLLTDEFKIEPEQDAKRKELESKFRNRYRKDTGSIKDMSEKEAKSFTKNYL